MARRKATPSTEQPKTTDSSNVPSGVVQLPESTAMNGRIVVDDAPREDDGGKASTFTAPPAMTTTTTAVTSSTEAAQDQRKYNLPEGLSKTQKKNLRKSLRNKERRAEEKSGVRPGVPQLPHDPLQDERVAILTETRAAFEALPNLAELSASDVLQMFAEQQTALDQLIATLADARENLCTKIKKPDTRRLSSQQLFEQIRDLSSLPDKDQAALSFLEEQLVLMVSWENARKMQSQFTELREKLEEKQRVNARCVERARQRDRLMKLAERVRVLKQLQPGWREDVSPKITASSLVSQDVELSADAQAALLPPSNIGRRMERLFGVVIDRASSGRQQQRTFTVSGLEADVKEALRFLEEADFTGNTKVTLDPRIMPSFVGKGGAGIRQLEDTVQCFFRTRDNTVSVLGTKENTQRALAHLRELSAQKPAESQTVVEVPLDHSAIARALTGKFQKIVRDIEAAHGVSIRIATGGGGPGISAESTFGADIGSKGKPAPRAAGTTRGGTAAVIASPDGRRPMAYLRGRAAQVTPAKAEFSQAISGLRAIELPAESSETLNRLFARVVPRRDETGSTMSPVRPTTQQSVADKFSVLVAVTDTVAFLKHNGGLALVGKQSDIEAVYEQARQLLEAASFTPTRISVPNEAAFVFSQERLALIECSCNVTVRRLRAMDTTTPIEIVGNDENKQKAEAAIMETLRTEAAVATIQLQESDTVQQLMRDGRKLLRDMEDLNGVRIAVDRGALTCKVVGPIEGLTTLRESLEVLDNKNVERAAKMSVVEISLPSSDLIRRIIGQKGASIQSIRESSRVDYIDIDDANLVVKVRGSPESCAVAERMLNDIVTRYSKVPSTTVHQPAPPQQKSSAAAAPSRPKQTVVASGNIVGNLGWGEAAGEPGVTGSTPLWKPNGNGTWGSSPHAATQNTGTAAAAAAGLSNEDAFPTLSEAAEAKQQKRVVRRRRKPATQQHLVTAGGDKEAVVGVEHVDDEV